MSYNNIANTDVLSKKVSLIILAAAAIFCSRALFFFFKDPEGPNVLIVAGLAAVIYLVSVATYLFLLAGMKGGARLSVAFAIQLLSVAALYFCMR